MIQKVLIAEDHESANISVQKTLEAIGIINPHYAYYCDDALLKIRKAIQCNDSYDLLITDLHFEEDHRAQNIRNGISLIEAVREEQPDLKILVFSAESNPVTIKKLFDQFEIDGYVRKARSDAKELTKAMDALNNNQPYYPWHLIRQTKVNNAYEFSDFDIRIISLMTQGKRQQDISEYFKINNIQPSGLSSIEKRLTYMKEALSFTTNEQLVAYCVKMEIV